MHLCQKYTKNEWRHRQIKEGDKAETWGKDEGQQEDEKVSLWQKEGQGI